MVKSLARGPEEKVTHATIKFWLHEKRSAGATVRVQVREMRAAHGENRKCFRAAPEEVPSLRRQGRSSDYRPLVSVQGRGLVRDRLRGKIHRRRKQDRKAGRGNQRDAGERVVREGKLRERGLDEGEFGQRDEREKNGEEKISLDEEIFAAKVSASSSIRETPRPVRDSAARAPRWLSGSRVCLPRRRKSLRKWRPTAPAPAQGCAARRLAGFHFPRRAWCARGNRRWPAAEHSAR